MIKHQLISANKQTEQLRKILFLLLRLLLAFIKTKEARHSVNISFLQTINEDGLKKFSLPYIFQQYIALIDLILTKQISIILHTTKFQQLEAGWRGLFYVVNFYNYTNAKIKMLNLSLNNLTHDLNTAIEVEQTQLFVKIYINELDSPGGEPFGLIIGNYEFTYQPQHLLALQSLAKIGMAAFCPIVLGIAATFFDLEHYKQFTNAIDLKNTLSNKKYAKWHNALNDLTMSFVGMLCPRMLMRMPYKLKHGQNFAFTEQNDTHLDLVWGNIGFYFAALVLYVFEHTGWFTNIVGAGQNISAGNLSHANKLCYLSEHINTTGIEAVITSKMATELNSFGFITFCQVQYKDTLELYACPALRQGAKHINNHGIDLKLHYVFCISRFAHYLKVLAREKLGLYVTAVELERFLQNWLMQYTASIDHNSPEMLAKYPLHKARVEILELKREPGHFIGNIWLTPHFQLEEIKVSLNLKAYRQYPSSKG